MKNLLIIDSHNLAHLARHAKAWKWMQWDGEVSGHIYGSIAKLQATISRISKPIQLIFTFDQHCKYHYEIFPDYKGHRERDPREDPVPDFRALVSTLPCKVAFAVEEEADDVIWTLTRKYYKKHNIHILSSDKDLWPLYKKATIHASGGKIVDKELIIKRFGTAKVSRIPLWKAIFGDPSDNIPGVKNLLKREIIPIIEQSDGTPKSFFKLARIARRTNTIKKVLEHIEQVELFFKLTNLRDVKVIMHKNKGDIYQTKSFLKHWQIVTLDKSLKYIFESCKL